MILFSFFVGLFLSLYGFIRWRCCIDGLLCTLSFYPIYLWWINPREDSDGFDVILQYHESTGYGYSDNFQRLSVRPFLGGDDVLSKIATKLPNLSHPVSQGSVGEAIQSFARDGA